MAVQGKGLTSFLLVLLLVCGAGIFLLPAPAIKWGIETYGSEQVGAKVEVDDVSFSWFSFGVGITGLEVTDPASPMENMLVIDQMQTAIDSAQLLNAKLYIDELSVEGIGLGEPRETSGALADQAPISTENDDGLSLESLGLPSTDDLVAKEKAIYEEKITAYQDKLAAQKRDIEKAIADLPGDEAVAAYKERVEAAKKKAKGPLGNLAALQDFGRIQKDVKKDIKKIKKVQSLIKQSLAELRKDYQVLKNLPNQSASEIISTLGLEKSVIANGGEMLLGGRVEGWIKDGLQAYGLLSGDDGKDGAAGVDVDGADGAAPQTSPDVLIRRTLLSGRLSQGVQEGEISGVIENISDKPSLHPEPATVNIKAAGKLLGKLVIDGVVDHRVAGSESDQFTFSLSDSSLVDYPLAEQAGLAVMLNKALLTGGATVAVNQLENLDVTVDALFDDLDVAAKTVGGGEASEVQQAMMSALNDVSEISIKGRIQGTAANPDVSIVSNLDSVLSGVLNTLIQRKVGLMTAQIRTQLESQMKGLLPDLDESLSGISGLESQTGERKTAIDSLLKQIK